MSHTIRGFQADQAILLIEQIAHKTGEDVAVLRVTSLFIKHGIVSHFTYWQRVDKVLLDLGFDYDEVFEVAP